MFIRLSDRYPCRGVLHTPHTRLSSTPTPFAGRLVGRMQYAPTLPAEKSDLKGWRGITFRRRGDEYVFHFSMSNRLSDRYPGRGVLHTPLIDSTSTLSPFAGRLVGRMQYAPTLSAEKSDLNGWYEVMFGTRRDEYVFHFLVSNRLLDRYPCRGVLHTPLARLSSTLSPLVGRLVGRMQYAPTLPEKDKVSLGRCFLLSRTMADQYVFLFSISNRLSDRQPGRAQKHTPLARLSSTLSPLAGRLVRRMQYAPTLPAEKSDFKGWCGVMFGTRGDKSVFHSIMSNRLSDGYLGRSILHTPLIDSTSIPSPLAGRLMGRMQYAPTLSEKEEVSSGRCFLSSRTMGDKSVFLFSMSNRLSDRYPGRAQKHTPHIDSTSTPPPFAGRLVGRMQYAPTLPEKDKVSLGRCYLLSRTMADKYASFFSMSNRLSDRYPGRGVLHTLLARLSSTLSPFQGVW